MSGSKAVSLWRQKLARFEEARAVATDTAEIFRLDHTIEEAVRQLDTLVAGHEFLDLDWSAVDAELMRGFFRACAAQSPKIFTRQAAGDDASIQGFLVGRGLACRGARDRVLLTKEGILLLAREDTIPHHSLHVDVSIEWRNRTERGIEKLSGSVLLLHREIRERLAVLSERVIGMPGVRDELGSETPIYEYPPVAVVEALTNFLIHRDYDEDDHGRINVMPDRLEFINPGTCAVPIRTLMQARKPIEPKYARNPRLIDAMNQAGYNQKKGSGLLTIREQLKKNGSKRPDGTVGLELWNDDEKQRFHLVLYRRDLADFYPAPQPRGPAEIAQKIAPSRLPRGADQLFGREAELAALDRAWAEGTLNVVSLVAWGGVGKTSLVVEWLAKLAARDFDGADYFDWSFYSQGTRDEGAASGEPFVNAALRFVGEDALAASAASSWDKGGKLAQRLGARRTLLVLDGLEPLQHPEGPSGGELKDPGVKTLLRALALHNTGLCVLTTREKVSDLASFRGKTVEERELAQLSTPAGLALLGKLGVHGAAKELEQLVRDVQGHALTLNLLGSYLQRAHGGDVRRRDRVELHKADTNTLHGHAFRAMATYTKWLEEGGEPGARQLAILRLVGLFDRAASYGCIEALREPPAIADLTAPLHELAEEDWNEALANLQAAGLVQVAVPEGSAGGCWGEGATLDAHPLLREYFAKELRTWHEAAWKAAHSRLYEHLRDKTEHQPATLEGLQPLYQAVVHGCHAGRQEEACVEVYWDRILRGASAYSTHQLGAFGADLGAVACFFEQRWTRLSPALTESDQAWLLNEAAFSLRALGRLREALEPMRAAEAMRTWQEAWKNDAAVAGNLSELAETLGELEEAEDAAERSVTYADRSGDLFQRMARRGTLAYARFQRGREAEAGELFREAEVLQREMQPEYPQLYSLPGFRYCELLSAGAERGSWGGVREEARTRLLVACGEVEGRAGQTLEWAKQAGGLLDVALDHLTLGRVQLYRALLTGGDPSEAAPDIAAAVDGLRRAGSMSHLPLGLLTRARLRWHLGDPEGARADLDETWEIASRGPMPLFLADVGLLRARLFQDRAALREARRLIERHGYGRRLPELSDAETKAGAWPRV